MRKAPLTTAAATLLATGLITDCSSGSSGSGGTNGAAASGAQGANTCTTEGRLCTEVFSALG